LDAQNYPFIGSSVCVANYTGTPNYNVVLKCASSTNQPNYPNTFSMLDFAAPDCSGIPLATNIFPLNVCVDLGGGLFSNYTCGGQGNIVGVTNCMDSACSVECDPVNLTSTCIGGASNLIPASCSTSPTQTKQTTAQVSATQVSATQVSATQPVTNPIVNTYPIFVASSQQNNNNGNLAAEVVVPLLFGLAIIGVVAFLVWKYRCRRFRFRLEEE